MADESFMLLNLRESKSKKLAQVIGNETARQILDFLTSKDFATESQISEHLGIPFSTVHYNLKALKESGLVVADEFHYSDKGKEVPHYKLAKKFIIIAPRDDDKIIDRIKKFLPVTGIAIAATAIIHVVSRFFTQGSGGTLAARSRSNDMLVPAAKTFAEAPADEMIRSMPAVAQGVQGFAESAMANASNVTHNASQTIQPIQPIISECILPPQAPWYQHPATWWFLAGSLFVIVVLVVWELVRRKDKP